MQARHRHPIADLLDILGRRWALRVLWELRGEALTFTALHRACEEVSSSVLTQRLNELAEAGVVERADRAYALSPRGRELVGHLRPLDAWARDWARRGE